MGRFLLALVTFLLVCSVGSAEARYKHVRVVHSCIETWVVTQSCDKSKNPFSFLSEFKSIKVRMTKVREHRSERRIRHIHRYVRAHGHVLAYAPYQPSYQPRERVSEVVGGRPPGCPHAYCGCGTSLHIFGRIIPALNLAFNWRRFPPAAPAPGRVAYRRGHVFAIEAVNPDGTVIAFDSNSGHGLTRRHAVSLRGYHVVDPHG